MAMLADLVDVVIGVDTHKHTHTIAIVTAATGAVVNQATVAATTAGYQQLLALATQQPGQRIWAIESTGGYGAGLTWFLHAHHEQVVELDRPKRAARRHGAKSDSLDATQLLDAETAQHTRAITTLVRAWRPELPTRTGVGPIVAAAVLCAWSHPGRCRSEAAFAMLGGAAPIPASSGQTMRYRLNRSGDRQLNQALHVVVMTRLRTDPATRAYAQRRRAQGKTNREINRCLVRYVARQLYRLLETPPALDATWSVQGNDQRLCQCCPGASAASDVLAAAGRLMRLLGLKRH
jgi:transposase